jgi:malate dehydrogenase (oxaloacetate-decarboxylating)
MLMIRCAHERYTSEENIMDYRAESLRKHYEWKGKIEVVTTVPVKTKEDLSLAYTPGVAEPCLEIQKDVSKSYDLTRRWNTVAVVTDGTAVLGLGDIGPEAGMPVMEGKCVLFKAFGGVDAIPLCVKSKEVDDIVRTVYLISGSLGGVNLEDISAPRCFEIEEKLKALCDIPIFHDDQHGTAVVTAAAMINALKLTGRKLSEQECVIVGAGAAGVACTKLLMRMGLKNVILCDRQGAIWEGRDGLNPAKAEMAKISNRQMKKGSIADALKGADILIGVSGPGIVTEDMIRAMNKNPIVFAMSNPTPEIMPELAIKAGAAVVGTGRSDFANQINNVLAFPGIFRGTLDVRASDINDDMKIAAAYAIAELVSDSERSAEYVIPAPFDPRIAPAVAKAVAEAARKSGVARI